MQSVGNRRGERHVDQDLHNSGVRGEDQREERANDHQGAHHANGDLAGAATHNVRSPQEERQGCAHGHQVQCGEPADCREHSDCLRGVRGDGQAHEQERYGDQHIHNTERGESLNTSHGRRLRWDCGGQNLADPVALFHAQVAVHGEGQGESSGDQQSGETNRNGLCDLVGHCWLFQVRDLWLGSECGQNLGWFLVQGDDCWSTHAGGVHDERGVGLAVAHGLFGFFW